MIYSGINKRPPHNDSEFEEKEYWERDFWIGVNSNLSLQDLAIYLVTNRTNNAARAEVVAGGKYVGNGKYHIFVKLCGCIYFL